jgi:hypothetical protein
VLPERGARCRRRHDRGAETEGSERGADAQASPYAAERDTIRAVGRVTRAVALRVSTTTRA